MTRWNIDISYNTVQTTHFGMQFSTFSSSFLIKGQICGECTQISVWSSLSGPSNDGALNQTVTFAELTQTGSFAEEQWWHSDDPDCIPSDPHDLLYV